MPMKVLILSDSRHFRTEAEAIFKAPRFDYDAPNPKEDLRNTLAACDATVLLVDDDLVTVETRKTLLDLLWTSIPGLPAATVLVFWCSASEDRHITSELTAHNMIYAPKPLDRSYMFRKMKDLGFPPPRQPRQPKTE